MPRRARRSYAPGFLAPGQSYHVANRGVDHCDLFHCDRDRIVFLYVLAEACLRHGVVCHAFCLMTNHFHLVLEDRRGQLPQLMHRVQSAYARYFNDTRTRRRDGPLFKGRFRAELLDTRAYFDAACAYVLLNPVRTKVPLAASAEDYQWSSAASVCSYTSTAQWASGLVAEFGGVDAILSAMRPTHNAASRALRRTRVEALASGAWLARERVLGGRAPDDYRRMLAERARRAATPDAEEAGEDTLLLCPRDAEVDDGGDAPGASAVPARVRAKTVDRGAWAGTLAETAPALSTVSESSVGFAGLVLRDVVAAVLAVCERILPESLVGSSERRRDVRAYILHRFTDATAEAVGAAVGLAVDRANEAIERVRGARRRSVGWERALWTLEWSLRWKLRAGPHRA